MSSITPQRSDDLLQAPDGDLVDPTLNFESTFPPQDLTPYIQKIDDHYFAGGGFGDVYKCQYVGGSVPQEVAVKALRFKYTLDGDAEDKSVKMLRRELGIWKRLRHNNIVPFLGIAYGFGMSGAMSLVSLWMPNETLHKFLVTHDDMLNVVHRLQILADITKGLDYLHSFPIVHGDLNSNNVLLDANYTARLADFGYASLAGNIPEALAYLERSTTRPGALRWIAPEQIDLDETCGKTTKSDIFSFGCVALQGSSLVLSGKQPWSEVREDASVVLRLHLGHKPHRPESREMHDSHWSFIQRCWLPLQERPSAKSIRVTIQKFLYDCPPSKSLRDLFIPLSHLDKGDQTRSPQLPDTTQLFVDLQSKLKKDSSVHTTSISTSDIAVFVLGPTGSGKSWFTKAATKSSLVKVGGELDLKPFTSDVQAIRCELTDEAKRNLESVQGVVLVDPPSFLTGYNHPGVQNELQAWLYKKSYEPRCVGVIYMHRIETDPALEPIDAHLQEFSKIPQIGDIPLPQRLHIVVSYDKTSGIISESKIAKRRAKLGTQVASLDRFRWKPSMHDEIFQGEPEVAWKAIEKLFQN